MVRRYTLVEPDRTIFFNSHMTDWLSDWMSELLPACCVAKSHSAVSYFDCTPGRYRPMFSQHFASVPRLRCVWFQTYVSVFAKLKVLLLALHATAITHYRVAEFFLCVFAVHSRCSFRRLQKKKKTPIPQKTGDGQQATAQKCWWEETKERRIFPNMLRWFGTTDRPFNVQQYHYYGNREAGRVGEKKPK